ncbi:hypothetical protein VTK56DRAFT_6609 [Thermocarpiscus australiensis]
MDRCQAIRARDRGIARGIDLLPLGLKTQMPPQPCQLPSMDFHGLLDELGVRELLLAVRERPCAPSENRRGRTPPPHQGGPGPEEQLAGGLLRNSNGKPPRTAGDLTGGPTGLPSWAPDWTVFDLHYCGTPRFVRQAVCSRLLLRQVVGN